MKHQRYALEGDFGLNEFSLRDSLKRRGAGEADFEALQNYLQSPYTGSAFSPTPESDKSGFWERRLASCHQDSLFLVLQEIIPQLRFPIQEGMRAQPDYRSATLKGGPEERPGGLDLTYPKDLQVKLHKTSVGAILALFPKGRRDFELLVQAFLGKNEPREVPPSMGACAISGYNNWARIQEMKGDYLQSVPDGYWQLKFAEIRKTPQLYQDQLLLISDGPYSNVSYKSLDLSSQEDWLRLSTEIRHYHESFHIYCKKRHGLMQVNAWDEVLADYAGIVGATGKFHRSWLLHFLGLESPFYRAGGRLENYRGELGPKAFEILCGLVRDAAQTLQTLETEFAGLALEERLERLLRYDLPELAEGSVNRTH